MAITAALLNQISSVALHESLEGQWLSLFGVMPRSAQSSFLWLLKRRHVRSKGLLQRTRLSMDLRGT